MNGASVTLEAVVTPGALAATGDPGDDTARRYRYQWTYAAIVSCMLLDETQQVTEIFCEHHEDVLLKHADGQFSGVQIKTRASDQDLWKTSDEAVIASCARFAKLEALFPGQFRAFHFLTNHPLFSADNGKDVRFVLQKFSGVSSVEDLPAVAKSFLSKVTNEAKCSKDTAFAALAKTKASDSLPKLGDIETRLVATVTESWDGATDCSYAAIVKAARNLVWECGRASSLAHEDVLPAYLPVTTNPIASELAARLAAKRIDRDRVVELLQTGLNRTAPLAGDPDECAVPGTGSPDLLIKKLNAGGFSVVSCNSALDLRDKADYLGIAWTKKYGRDHGLKRYDHIRSMVLQDSAGAFETTKVEGKPFGLGMLDELRSRFSQRRTNGDELYDCRNEHLEGVAYALTSQCVVQWSLDRPWETK